MGISVYALVTWPYDVARFAQRCADAGLTRGLTRIWLMDAWAREVGGYDPVVRLSDGRYDLHQWRGDFFERHAEAVQVLNAAGLFVQLTTLELYCWSQRKGTLPGVPDRDENYTRANVNGIRWGDPSDDAMFGAPENPKMLPDAWHQELVGRMDETLQAAGCQGGYAYELGNEMPEKGLHERLRDMIRGFNPDVEAHVNRNEDTPGQFWNMQIGTKYQRIAFHGLRDLEAIHAEHPDEAPAGRPVTFAKMLEKLTAEQRRLVIHSSDGCRSSYSVDPYNWDDLFEAQQYFAERGCNVEHQSKIKMAYFCGEPDYLDVDKYFEHDYATRLATLQPVTV